MTKEEEIQIVHGNGTHVVILGAGASFAATLHRPEKNGKSLPLMRNIIDIVGLGYLVDQLPNELKILKEDFEKLYSNLVGTGKFQEEQKIIEQEIYNYFNEMDLPEEPTIYDYLILALRNSKDVIATFNWDPFLYKAYVRNGNFVKSPGILFLHGCVSIGYDIEDKRPGPAGMYSKETLNKFEPTKLLYPVGQKDYNTDPFIKGQWDALAAELNIAERVTIFGYSAPATDVEAIGLLQNAWGNAASRSMEEFEIVDIRKEDEVKESWKTFIHTHHYHYTTDYFGSSLAQHPRRTVESYHHWAMPLSPSEAFQKGNKIPSDIQTMQELWDWHIPLVEAEAKLVG